MSKAERLFNFRYLVIAAVLLTWLPLSARASEMQEFKGNASGTYRDIFDQNIFYEGTKYLNFDRLFRAIRRQPVRAKDINVFDEVPDNAYFTNRHARKKLSAQALEKGYSETEGPDTKGPLTVLKAKFFDSLASLLVRDSRGDEYVLKFDPYSHLALATSSEVIASRFYYAIGYNVPQYSIVKIRTDQLVIGPNALLFDDSGFQKKLTQEKLQERFLFLPVDTEGNFRASAGKILPGTYLGTFQFKGRGKHNPGDSLKAEERRSIRALQVFASWLNDYRMSRISTLAVAFESNGKREMKYYLTDFEDTLGAVLDREKAPMFTHEYLFDYGETIKSFVSLGGYVKPWQKRWKEADEKSASPAVGYFDNRYFDPGRFKTQLPHDAFKDLTPADAFWAAKTVMSFSDDEIAAMVKAGRLSRREDEDHLTKTLAERRDLIGRYWFERACPLDDFKFSGTLLSFTNLAVQAGFQDQGAGYQVDIDQMDGKKRQPVASFTIRENSIDLGRWLGHSQNLWVGISPASDEKNQKQPHVFIQLGSSGILSIEHED
ncbi:MAG: hypothetical protein COV74_02060 [Candidatus Omnitrophica bacterium CG11_big_fil_rev_8_21_14_0_20_45_26]|uniref:Uncharacterized protein n=1 Tax=Candidatus Abzuiibacterium crystallinum TaxID=1974748 RepID=A0A2H0LRV2_9BACT|nr:MAG: hypothetical protein COV74_02060 [Candidatus Omnitrophica bacterium CG11_big_fil_rev_8_21_14_0_20_45_26]PIW63310.1 MAG: hypothetical protein COW12_10890 [Candidatus Omnitrophica bacterium CG12_big_fil_rev_8_21_14_0_65_45_16]